MAKDNIVLSKKYNDKKLRRIFPHWVPALYGAGCVALIPWIIYLSYLLPPKYISVHWSVAWTGFDILECILFAVTALLAIKRSSWTALTSAMLGTVLLLDAWFDVLTSRSVSDQHKALLEALIELPLALISFAVSHRIFDYVRHNPTK